MSDGGPGMVRLREIAGRAGIVVDGERWRRRRGEVA